MRKRQNSAFTLIELVFVLLITSLILAAVAALTARTLDTLKFMEEKSKTMQSATLGVERLSSELSETVVLPTGNVSFRKANPNAPVAHYQPGISNDYADPNSFPPHLWTRAYTGGDLVTVTYAVAGTDLTRTAGGGPTGLIATSVNAFTVTNVNPDGMGVMPAGGVDGNYRVALSIQELRRVVTFETVVHCPGVPR